MALTGTDHRTDFASHPAGAETALAPTRPAEERSEPAARLPQIRATLEAYHFTPQALHVTSMLDDIHSDQQQEAAPPGASYLSRVWIKHAHAAA